MRTASFLPDRTSRYRRRPRSKSRKLPLPRATNLMKDAMKPAITLIAAALFVVGAASAQETRLRSTRVSAPDVIKTATFYESVFGLKEVREEVRDGKPFEKILNYAKDAANNPAGPPNIVIIL